MRSATQTAVQAAYPKPGGAKRAICFEAAKLVKDGDIIFIDSGTTTVQIIEAIKDRNVTVITNNIQVMTKALDYENIRIIMQAIQFFSHFHPWHSFRKKSPPLIH